MINVQDPNFNKNVSMVYISEPGFTGYRGLDFTKIDDIEIKLDDLQTSISSGLAFGINVHQDDLSYLADSVNARGPILESIDSKLFVTGDPYPAGVQGTIVFQADLTQQFDAVTSFPEQSTGISNSAVGESNGTILAANQYRRELFVQNLDTGVLYVKYGLAANASSFNFVLAANSATNAGDGGSLNDQGYVGNVSVSGEVTPRYISWERTDINKTPLV
jgi:hypothetical protein